MGLLDWLRGEKPADRVASGPSPTPGRPSASATVRAGAKGFATWRDPAVPPATTEWERRLNAYAAKCARTLTERGVARWRSADARDGRDTFHDAFWVVSVDVDQADRYFLKNDVLRHRSAVVKQGDFGGRLQGHALLLTTSGTLFSARTEMFFPRTGNHEDGNLDSLFYSPSRELLESSPWAGLNIGGWRRQPDSKVYGVVSSTMRSEFRGKYPSGVWINAEPGKGTSIALSKFLNSGRTQWPRHFDEFYGR